MGGGYLSQQNGGSLHGVGSMIPEFSLLQMLSGISIFVTKLLLKMRQLETKMWYFEPKMRKLLFKIRQLESKMWYFKSQIRNFR